MIARWYISGHAPWSDAYESMIYVAWATMFFTLAFDIKSKLLGDELYDLYLFDKEKKNSALIVQIYGIYLKNH